MRRAALAVTVGLLAVAGCGEDDPPRPAGLDPRQTDPTSVDPEPIGERDAPVPAGLDAGERRRFEAGRRVTARSGCLACHQIGRSGNDGPGPQLTGVGERLPPAELRAALLDPRAPMPSFANLPARRLDELVTFLSGLRGRDAPPRSARGRSSGILGRNCRREGDTVRC